MALALDKPLPANLFKTNARARQPPDALVPLKDHQLAMLQRCFDIEKLAIMSQYKMAFMGDGVSSGKTFVCLAMPLTEKAAFRRTALNIIVVPQNICMQWREEIRKLAGDALKVMTLIDYQSIANLQFSPAGLAVHDIVLTTPAYFTTLAEFCEKNRVHPKRVIIDEADTIANMVSRKIPGTMTWFVSATMDRLPESKAGMVQVGKKVEGIEDATLQAFDGSSLATNTGQTLRAEETGTYEIPARLVRSGERLCRCDPDWIQESFGIPPPIKHKVLCSNVYIDVLACLTFCKVLQPKQLESANARDFRNLRAGGEDEFQALPNLIKRYETAKADAEMSLSGLRGTMHMEERVAQCTAKIEGCNRFIDAIRDQAARSLLCQGTFEQLAQPDRKGPPVDRCYMCNDCQAGYSVTWVEQHAGDPCLKCGSKGELAERMPGEPARVDNKVTKLCEIVKDLVAKESEKPRIIVFAKYTQAFSAIQAELGAELVVKEADAGTAVAAQKMLEDFKGGKIDVLLAESSLFCSGMNLPELTDVCFLHVVHAYSDAQIAGRAQRPGRKGQCRIWTFLHDNES